MSEKGREGGNDDELGHMYARLSDLNHSFLLRDSPGLSFSRGRRRLMRSSQMHANTSICVSAQGPENKYASACACLESRISFGI